MACVWNTGSVNEDLRLHAPATARNREPLLQALKPYIRPAQRVLEVGSGSGEHAMFLASRLGVALWQPSDPNPRACASIHAWRLAPGELWATAASTESTPPPEACTIVQPAQTLDVSTPEWWASVKSAPFDALISVNVVHIAPWQVAEGLFAGAGHLLPAGGALCLYGPFRFPGEALAPSNEDFDLHLKGLDPTYGIRAIDDLIEVGASQGLALSATLPMPANNHVLVFRRNRS